MQTSLKNKIKLILFQEHLEIRVKWDFKKIISFNLIL